ncbi:glycosyltransferase family A protein [Paenibacillus sp. NFR01]|uniref:glycosyltransferase family 2 protein n=1 Tax=Paenibacillus sp. NFR01 TaxID=1566279 RepID=UPI0008B3D8A3|nr:glycosyltransferase family A protein [Paenibacillus sp. NFR01]SEU23322.1 Glycosyltransferase involved in cell wall bisynthesis [Paenibacillus sp. NFR01]
MTVSIVVPMYNLESYITTLLESLLAQSDKRFELVLVNDGSTDRTAEVAAAFLSQHPVLRSKLITRANGGVSAARNAGLAEAEGDYVMFLDGDDYADRLLVQRIEEQTRDGQPDALCWGYDLVREDKSPIASFVSEPADITGGEALQRIFVKRSLRVWTGSIAFRRQFLLEHGIRYTERCASGEDQELIYKALTRAQRVVVLPDVLTFYVQRKSSITGSYNVQKFDVVDAFKRVDGYFKAHPFREADAISELLLGRELTENYFYNLRTCLTGTARVNIWQLLRDIDSCYPALNSELQSVMRRYPGDDRQLALQIRAFRISPKLYQWLVAADGKWSGFKHRIKTAIFRKEINV